MDRSLVNVWTPEEGTMSQCPSCGRHTGPYEACPYCGARSTGRTPIRIVKIAAILLATVGLVALWFAATRAEVPLIQIGQAGATMNMAYVRIQGRCTREPSYDPASDYLSFWLADETGEIRVSAYRAETREIIAQGLVPGLGDQVEVAGTLRVREDFLALTINVPDQLTVTRAEPVALDIGAIVPDDLYMRVRVQGQIDSVFEPYEGLLLVTVRDQTGEIPIAVSEDLVALSGETPKLSAGQSVEVVAAVSVYGDTPQLVPASLADIVVVDRGLGMIIEKPIGELTSEDEGQLATVRGTIIEVNQFSSGVKYTLDDGTGTIVVLLWQCRGFCRTFSRGWNCRSSTSPRRWMAQSGSFCAEPLPGRWAGCLPLSFRLSPAAWADSSPGMPQPNGTIGCSSSPRGRPRSSTMSAVSCCSSCRDCT
jgi:DNA/RNA endonuclease YhcR with UshA esterase domain